MNTAIIIWLIVFFAYANEYIVRKMLDVKEQYSFVTYLGMMFPSFLIYLVATVLSPLILLYIPYYLSKKAHNKN